MNKEEIIERMASDMGMFRFMPETEYGFRCRVLYSGMACWIKTSAMDTPIGRSERCQDGVSRRHVFEKCNKVLESLLGIYPDLKQWFDNGENENAISIIRSRLLRHGDLLNIGFDTNIALSCVKRKQLTEHMATYYGDTIRNDSLYAGVSLISYEESNAEKREAINASKWFEDYIKEAWWERGITRLGDLEFLNSAQSSKNNYDLWQTAWPANKKGVILSRKQIYKKGYEYYLIRYADDLYHRLDPLMIELGEYIRIILVLRSKANNRMRARACHEKNHVKLELNCILPIKERTILESYAWPVKAIDDSLEWVMLNEIWEYFKPFLEALEIQVMEETNG